MATAPVTKDAGLKPASELAAASSRPTPALEPQADACEHLYLIGRPTLKQFLRYVKNHAVNPPGPGVLTEEWQAANEIVRTLEKEEAGLADNPTIEPLAPDNELLLEFVKDPIVQNSFNTVLTEVAYVNLNQMVVYQPHIDLTFVRELKSRLGPAPTEEEIFHACLPHEQPQAPVKWSRVHQDTYIFLSPSNDLRFLSVMPLQRGHIKDYPPPGNIACVVGLAVGFGSNFLNAIYAEKRLIL
ncbi:MAG TPA: hypothetical protein VNB49_07490, partial [Candidatus Dormibacteraeota bacterium]|nr:hypothetical protein [Candidatus Dormibacteraeota bacterium]